MFRRLVPVLLAFCLLLAAVPAAASEPANWTPHGHPFVATYAGTLRAATPRADGINHVDTPRMIRRLKQLHVTSYWYLVWYTPTEWQDFVTEFEPAAEKAGIDVYLYLVGPSECRPVCSAPYNTDFVAWGNAIGALSKTHPNIKGWAIDDFIYNTTLFTPQYVKSFVDAGHAHNPNLKFYSQVYQNNLTPQFVKDYTPVVDGYVLAFRDDPYHNTQVTSSLAGQLDSDVSMVRSYGKNLVLMTYAGNLSGTAMPPSKSYVDTVTRIGLSYLRQGKLAGIVQYVLSLNDQAESAASFDHARSGNGALSLLDYHSDTNGGYAQAAEPVRVSPASDYSVDFWAGLHFGGSLGSGTQQLQMLVDGNVVWQVNPATLPVGSYVAEHVDLTAALQGKQTATLAFRLTSITAAHNFYAGALIDDISSSGFTVPNSGFETRSGWVLTTTGRPYIPDFDIFDPDRGRETYAIVQAQYGPHSLVIRAADAQSPELLPIAQAVLRDYLAEARQAAAEQARILAARAKAAGETVLADQAAAVVTELT